MRLIAAGITAMLVIISAERALALGDLVDHRALYNMSLMRSTPGSDIQGLSGQMLLEVKGTCGGTTVTQLLKTNTWGDDQVVQVGQLTASSFESDDGKRFRFTMHNEVDGQVVDDFQGTATRKKQDAEGRIAYDKKRYPSIALPGHTVFPSAYMVALLNAAKANRRVVEVTVFDGAAEDKVYHSTSIIGQKSDAEKSSLVQLKGVAHWPVDLSYFPVDSDDPLPDYESSFDLYANGVSSRLVMDYGDFAMKGELASLEILPVTKCGKKG